MQTAQPENDAPHGDEAWQGEFETDREHQEDDAELRKVLRAGKAFEQVESVRPDQRANDQVAEHRRQIHAPEEDDRHH